MEAKVINISDYIQVEKKSVYQSVSNSGFEKQYIGTESFIEIEDKKQLNDFYVNTPVSHEAMISFIIDYGVKLDETDSKLHKHLARNLQHCISFYGITYYIPNYKFNAKDQEVFDYLIDNNKVYIY